MHDGPKSVLQPHLQQYHAKFVISAGRRVVRKVRLVMIVDWCIGSINEFLVSISEQSMRMYEVDGTVQR